MPQCIQTFSRANVDDADEVRPASDFVSAVNIALESGEAAAQRGNVLVPYVLPVGTNKAVGACDDNAGGVIDFVSNSAGNHVLTRYNQSTGARTLLLQGTFLSLSAIEPVLGATVLDGLLIYRDANKELRSIPLDDAQRAAAVAAIVADPFALHLVKQPPHLSPIAGREYDPSTTDPRAQNKVVAANSWQFAYQYEYPDGGRTPLSPFSDVLYAKVLVPEPDYTTPLADRRNVIRVAYPMGALAPSPLVSAVRLLVRRAEEADWTVAGEMTPGVLFSFYGETTGEVLTVAEATKLAEAIPVKVEAMAVAHSRIFVGDCTEGYAPSIPAGSLSAAISTIPVPAPTATTIYDVQTGYTYYDDGPDGNPIQRSGTRDRLFALAPGSVAYPDPASRYYLVALNAADGLYYPVGYPSTYTYFQAFEELQPDESSLVVSTMTGQLGGTLTPATSEVTYHDRAVYPVGVAFYDALGRTAGAEAVISLQTPRQNYAAPTPKTLRWSLPIGLIPPPWATSYGLVLGENRFASFYLSFTCQDIRQYRGIAADGSPDLRPITTTGTSAILEVWVGLAELVRERRGYVFASGDRLRFPQLDVAYGDVEILRMEGGYLVISSAIVGYFLGTAPALTFHPVVEIYTPAANVATQVLYERGPRWPITGAGTPTATLTVTSGTLDGDSLFQPATFVTEAMFSSNSHWGAWLSPSRGRAVAMLPKAVPVHRSTLIRFSGVKVQGTKINGLGTWDALNQYEELPQEQGSVTRLTVADQTQTDGSIMLVNQERGDDSLTLGRGQIQTADGMELLTITKQVIGGSNALRGGYGCTDPAAVAPYGGKVIYPCRRRAEVLAYDRNGLVPLGESYKFRKRLQALFALHAADALTACFDPRRKEYWLTFHGSLPTTVVFSVRRDAWADEVSAVPDTGWPVADELLTWQNGGLWRHTPDAPSETFFGVKTRASITTVAANPDALLTKTWQAIGINSDSPWEPTLLTTRDGQQSRILPAWMKYTQGVYRAAIRRDENTPGAGSVAYALNNGRVLQSTALRITLSAPVAALGPLKALSVEFLIVAAQRPNQ